MRFKNFIKQDTQQRKADNLRNPSLIHRKNKNPQKNWIQLCLVHGNTKLLDNTKKAKKKSL